MSRFNRSNYYPTVNIDSFSMKDFLSGNISKLKISRPTTFYTISHEDIGRPDLLSLKLYNKQDYWWILGYVNTIYDWWNDIQEGDVIRVIDTADIQDWFADNL